MRTVLRGGALFILLGGGLTSHPGQYIKGKEVTTSSRLLLQIFSEPFLRVLFFASGPLPSDAKRQRACWEVRNIYHHHHPESKKRKSSEANSGSLHPYSRYGNAVKARKTISTIAILWPVKAIFEKRAATVEVDTLISPGLYSDDFWGSDYSKKRREGNMRVFWVRKRQVASNRLSC